ncbi:Transposase, IS116/IS110/IS902 [Moorella glycerini]|uniref:Transposase IS116/IS110/IS902 family protein n=1 Tax=Neomoorella stamsii TaxID=1266720 RepID=A0A9X7P5J7_9FIRM|nr:Transposase IS116/IS110/IS902 family protein [Moorella stamsii]CEP66577.1 Transposase, IS116/IS110/IS902 [Moorella glycerini]
MGKTLFVGIDIGSDTNVVRILDDTGEDVCGFSVSNDLPGAERLVERIVAEAELLDADKVKIGMEATNLYWWHLSQALHEAPELSAFDRDAVDVTLAMSLETIRFFETQQKKIDQVIAKELKAIPQTLDTVPGIGPVYSADIIAEIGDISRFKNHKCPY